MQRRNFLFGSVAAIATLAAPAVVAAERKYNHYVAIQAERENVKTLIVGSRDTWKSLFGTQAEVARFYNRQNLQLEPGQMVLVPPRGVKDVMSPGIAPFGSAGSDDHVFVLVSPEKYAWGLFGGRQLVRWGPAVCGGDWCADVERSCRSPSGTFSITEVAGPDRRSGSYPKELAAEGKGALMPYFMRLTDYGVGLHARYLRGRHETHGCVGMFYDDAKWLNQEYAEKHDLRVKITKYPV